MPGDLSMLGEAVPYRTPVMPLRALCGLVVLLSLAGAAASGQLCTTTHTTDLYCLIPAAFHTKAAPFNALFTPFGTELSELPTARPAGLVLKFEHGLPVAVNESLGAVFTERAESLGRNRLFLGVTYQNFRFSTVDGNDLNGVPIVLVTPDLSVFTVTRNRFDIRVAQYTAVAAAGLTSRLDLSVAVPFERVSMAVEVHGTEYGLGGATAAVNEYVPGSSTGFADIVLGVKAHTLERGKYRLATGLDVRLPTGDELNFLGSGTLGLRPYLAVSRGGRISPHANFGYQANGKTILNPNAAGTAQRLPTNLVYNAGANIEVSRRWTVVADLLGREFFHATRLSDPMPVAIPAALSGIGSALSVQPRTGAYTTNDFSVGAKTQTFGRLIVTGTVTLQLNDGGLRAKVVPLGGLSYSF